VLGLLALFTHMHIFWVAGLLLALIDLPDFTTPLRRMAGSLETMAGLGPGAGGGKDEEPVLEPLPGGGKEHVVAMDRIDRSDAGGELAPSPMPGGKRPRPVLARTRDKEITDA
jgi:hypothetical protein